MKQLFSTISSATHERIEVLLRVLQRQPDKETQRVLMWYSYLWLFLWVVTSLLFFLVGNSVGMRAPRPISSAIDDIGSLILAIPVVLLLLAILFLAVRFVYKDTQRTIRVVRFWRRMARAFREEFEEDDTEGK